MTYLSTNVIRGALRAALQTRQKLSIPNESPINVFDLAERLGIEVKFASIGSFSGMWVKDPPTILVSSLRPYGRQAFTCAHELGHWFFRHGLKVDLSEIHEIWQSSDQEELLVNTYAGFLLMPSWTIRRAFDHRSWLIEHCTPMQVYVVSCQLGVSYEALITHMCHSVKLISRAHAQRLLNESPSSIRSSTFPGLSSHRMVIVDKAWERVPIDLQVGDHVYLPNGAEASGKCVSQINGSDGRVILEAVRTGTARLHNALENWSAYARVSRKDFEGRSLYRHMEDPEANE